MAQDPGFWTLVMFLVMAAQAPEPAIPAKPFEAGKEFYHDFRNNNFSDSIFELTGANAEQRIRPEPEGLRITLTGKEYQPVGVNVRFPIKGDFEITVGYELIQADPPKAGWAVGFDIFLQTETATKEVLGFNHVRRRDGSLAYTMGRRTTNQQGKREDFMRTQIPTSAMSGHLRLTRVGAAVALSAAGPGSEEFQPLSQMPLGTEDINQFRLAALSGGANPVDLRLIDLRVRGANSSDPKVRAPFESAVPIQNPAVWIFAGLIALSLVTGGLWIWSRREKKGVNDGLRADEGQ